MIASRPRAPHPDNGRHVSTATSYPQLDEVQEAVASSPLGEHVVLLGAPGTGKTATVRELIARRIREFGPGAALVIAPTRKAATALRDPLALQVGQPTHGPLARTAGSVAFEIVRGVRAAETGEAPVLLTGGEHDAILRELLELEATENDGWPEKLGPEVRELRAFRQELRNLFQAADELSLTEEALSELGRRAERPEWVAAARLLERYLDVREQYLGEALDASTVLSEATYLVGEGRAGEAFSNLRTIVLDDAQDATPGVLALLNAFAERGVDIVVVGDPDAATAGFRSGVASIASAPDEYAPALAGAHRVVLPTVYRQSEKLRSAISRVTRRIGTALAGDQREACSVDADKYQEAGEDGAIPPAASIALPSRAAETAFIARILREKRLLEEVPWHDLAVVARDGATVSALARDLATSLVPVTVQGSIDVRDEPAARALTLIAEIVTGRVAIDGQVVADLLTSPLFALDAVGMRRLRIRVMRHAIGGRADPREAAESAHAAESVDEVLVRLARGTAWDPRTLEEHTLSRLAGAIERSAAVVRDGGSIEEVFWAIWQSVRVQKGWVEQSAGQGSAADSANRHLDAVVALFNAAKRYVERHPDGSADGFLAEWLESELPTDTLSPRARFDSVTVTTPAGLVGEEFSLVIVAGVQEGVWPNLRIRGSLLGAESLRDAARGVSPALADARREVLSDELRMLYSALGKARDRVILTAVSDEDTSPSALHRMFPDLPQNLAHSRPLTLRGLTGALRRELTSAIVAGAEARKSAAASALSQLAQAGVSGADPASWYGLSDVSSSDPIVDLTAEGAVVRVSPSQIERYDTCPLSWFLSQYSGYEGSTAASLGTLVHEAFESAEPGMTADEIWPIVENGFSAIEVESDWDRQRLLGSARTLVESLARYLSSFAQQPDARFLTKEQRFQHDLPLGTAVVRLSGSIDAIEQYTGADGRPHYAIVDLKTGKNEKTSEAAIAENPQLSAYQLAASGGGVEGITPESDQVSDGAKLVIVNVKTKDPYVEAHQQPFEDAERAAFEQRVREVAVGMAASEFDAMVGTHCYDAYSFGNCATHLVKPVSA